MKLYRFSTLLKSEEKKKKNAQKDGDQATNSKADNGTSDSKNPKKPVSVTAVTKSKKDNPKKTWPEQKLPTLAARQRGLHVSPHHLDSDAERVECENTAISLFSRKSPTW